MLKKKIGLPLVAGMFLGAFLVSTGLHFVKDSHSRRIFYFSSYDTDGLCTEIRYLSKADEKMPEAVFIEDILLGPLTNRYKSVFPKGTRLEFCFEKDGILYVGLSEEALKTTAETADIRGNIVLLKKNISENFSSRKRISVFIGGEFAG